MAPRNRDKRARLGTPLLQAQAEMRGDQLEAAGGRRDFHFDGAAGLARGVSDVWICGAPSDQRLSTTWPYSPSGATMDLASTRWPPTASRSTRKAELAGAAVRRESTSCSATTSG
jgi:hypothetical protein